VELATYIKNLLYNHEKVIIHGLGALQTVYKAAEINSSQRTINPPSKKLVFDVNSANSDGLLEKSIAAQNKITKKAAEMMVSEQVQQFMQKLNSGETILLENIGYFSKENEIIRFECAQEANYLTDSFGLSKVEFKPAEFKLSGKNTDHEQVTKKRRSYTYVIMFLILVVLVGGGIGTYLYYPDLVKTFKKFTQKEPAKAQPLENTNAQKNLNDTTKQSDLAQVVDSNTNKKAALSLNTMKNAPTAPEKISYYIIAGSFKTYDRATILSKQLKKEGFTPEVIQFDREIFRVSLGEFKDKPEALKELDKIKSRKGEGAVWLLTKKI
jgi:nucleoid DNA-binding protein/cell division septation protein DedD